MVSLRSGNSTEAEAAAAKGVEVSSRRTPARRSARTPSKAAPTTSRKSKKRLSAVDEQHEQEEFLKSPGMHTRAGTPIPNISLSTELPAQLVAELATAAGNTEPSGQAALRKTPAPSAQRPAEDTDASTDLSTEQSLPAEQDVEETAPSADVTAAEKKGQGQAGASPAKKRTHGQAGARLAKSETHGPAGTSLAEVGPQGQAGASLAELGAQGQAGTSLAGQQRVQAAPDLDPSSTSDSDSDEEGDPLGGLAASMWAALQRQRRQPGVGGSRKAEQPGAGASGAKEKPGAGRSSGGLAGSAAKSSAVRRITAGGSEGDDDSEDESEAEVLWEPKTSLPALLHEFDSRLGQVQRDEEPGLSKQLVALPRNRKQEAKAAREQTGRDWFELPMTPITDEMKRDLRLLRLRGAMDTKRFYKKGDKGKFPTRFAVGTIVEGPTEFHSSRLARKDRKRTITEELLADPQLQESRVKRYSKLQEEASRWSHKKAKTSNERIKKRKHPPRH